jgi:hypothetical protein
MAKVRADGTLIADQVKGSIHKSEGGHPATYWLQARRADGVHRRSAPTGSCVTLTSGL